MLLSNFIVGYAGVALSGSLQLVVYRQNEESLAV